MDTRTARGRFGAEPDHRSYTENDEKRQYDELREFEWLFGLRRRHCVQRRYFFKRLHDENKDVEIKRNDRTDDVNPAPCSGQMFRIARENCDREERQRNNSECNSWREAMERKEEARDACRDGRDQEPLGPAIETFPASSPHKTTRPVKMPTRLISV